MIQNTDLTHDLPKEIIWELSYGLKVDYCNSGSYMICSGERKWCMYFIHSGECELSIYCLGRWVMIEQIYKGCSIGTYSCLSGIPIELTALAKTHISYYTLEFAYI